eukprot:jgi/Psemu1/285595/fgenesh1_pg.94_\
MVDDTQSITDPICLPPSFVRTCLDRAGTDHRFLEGLLEREREQIQAALGGGGGGSFCFGDHHRLAALTRQDYSEWVARDGGRVDVRYKLHQYPYNCGGLIYNPIVFPLVRALLNGDGDGDGESGRTDENNDDKNEAVQLLYAGIINPQAGPGTAATAPGECIATADAGVGERWVLFQMTLELPDGTSSILRVISGDVPVEVAQQFCFRHGLSDDFVPVLAQTIEEQMKESATIV